jgi:hypothetical protein
MKKVSVSRKGFKRGVDEVLFLKPLVQPLRDLLGVAMNWVKKSKP